MSFGYAAVIALSIVTWVIPVTAAFKGQRPNRIQFSCAILMVVVLLTSILLAAGPEYAAGFLLVSLSVGGVLTWAVVFDSP